MGAGEESSRSRERLASCQPSELPASRASARRTDFCTDRYGPLQAVNGLLELAGLPVHAAQAREHPRFGLHVPSAPGGGKAKGVEIPPVGEVPSEIKEAPQGIGELPGSRIEVPLGGLLR